MSAPHPIPAPLAELIAARFRVLAEPTRIRILDRLREGEATVGELGRELGLGQQNVSKHVGVLAQAGLVVREKEGTSVRCRIADPSVFDLCDLVCGGIARRVEEVRSLLDVTEATP
jgi:DNA-binding transcriptional ArsR family regulator